MPTDAGDARVLLHVSPDAYVTERTRLVKLAKADGDRALAGFLQSLKHPGRSLWAVLAAGQDAEAVRGIMTATTELAEVQAGGSDPRSLSSATKQRRTALEGVVDHAIAALARWDAGAETRRAEIRGLVDQLSRHPDVAEAWIDGTLRELPGDSWGFGAFTGLEVAAAPPTGKPSRAARAERTGQVRQARQDVAAAERELNTAERAVDAARKSVRDAEAALRRAEKDRSTAEQRHKEATARLESSQDD